MTSWIVELELDQTEQCTDGSKFEKASVADIASANTPVHAKFSGMHDPNVVYDGGLSLVNKASLCGEFNR